MITIDLNNLQGIPESYIKEIHSHSKVMKRIPYFDQLSKIAAVEQVIKAVDDYCRENHIYGYHYTNIIPGEIEKCGMLLRTGSTIRKTTLSNLKDTFSSDEILQIEKAWEDWFGEHQARIRDNVIYFNFTLSAFNTSGSELLLKYYGGEQNYWPLMNIKNLTPKLTQIGKPAIIKCKLNPNKIRTHNDLAWGSIIVSKIHGLYNKDAIQFDQDGRVYEPVLPEDCQVIYLKNVTGNFYSIL